MLMNDDDDDCTSIREKVTNFQSSIQHDYTTGNRSLFSSIVVINGVCICGIDGIDHGLGYIN